MAKAVELPFFIHGEALYGRASEELFIVCEPTVDVQTKKNYIVVRHTVHV